MKQGFEALHFKRLPHSFIVVRVLALLNNELNMFMPLNIQIPYQVRLAKS